jgi:hypothetical protein
MASGADRDDEEHIETQRLTGRDCNQFYELIFQFNVFVVTKYMTFILLFRCHLKVDFDMGQREGIYLHKTDQFISSMLVLFSWMPV